MSLINCPECGAERVSSLAAACPHCGFPVAEYLKKEFNARVSFIRAAEVDISSEQIRTWLENGKKNVGKYLPDGVLDYIRAHHLYEKNDQ